MARIYVSIGSNIAPQINIPSAITALGNRFGKLIVSTVFETQAVGFKGDNFYNLVVGLDTEVSPYEVVRLLREIENEHGRDRTKPKFSSRTLDMDLLLYGDLVLNEDGLEIPRAEITRYAFVLEPLAEIAGERQHPVLGQRYVELWAAFDKAAQPLRAVPMSLPG